jgi:hypothetical protein
LTSKSSDTTKSTRNFSTPGREDNLYQPGLAAIDLRKPFKTILLENCEAEGRSQRSGLRPLFERLD